jgi:hypothetical protein
VESLLCASNIGGGLVIFHCFAFYLLRVEIPSKVFCLGRLAIVLLLIYV